MRRLVFSDQARAELAGLERAIRIRIAAAIQRFLLTNAGNIKKLQGIEPPEYWLRVGDWRVFFSYPDSETVRIIRVRKRREAYR